MPHEEDDILKVNIKVLLTLYHTQCIQSLDASLFTKIKILAYMTLVINDEDACAHLNAMLHDDQKWHNMLMRDDPSFTLKGNVVYYNNLLFIPLPLCTDILYSCHDSPFVDHPKCQVTLSLV